MKLFRILAIVLLVLTVGSAAATPTVNVNNNVTVLSSRLFDYVVVIVMENWDVNSTYNCGNICDPFLTPFANTHAFSTNFRSTYNASLPSYFALTMAQHNPGGIECSPNPNEPAKTLQYCPQDFRNIVDIVERGGLTWKAYAEDYPWSCGTTCSPGNCYVAYSSPNGYAGSHNPFVYYTDIVNSSARCSRIIPANNVTVASGPETDDNLLYDLSSTTKAPNFMWLIPNECDQMHHLAGCNWPNVSDMRTQGSMYLSNMVPQILGSPVFQNQKAALFITFDECQNVLDNTCDNTNRIYTLWASANPSVVKQGFKSNNFYNHYSFLHTLEWAWNLQTLTRNDALAPIMKEYFA